MKLTYWLKTIITPLVTKPEDADMFLSASDLRDVEVPEDMQKAFNSKYMTADRAMSDETIVKKFQKEARGMVFGSVDQKLKKLLPKLSQEDQDKINAEQDTLVKLELFDRALDNISKNEDIKKVNEGFRKKEEELRGQITALESKFNQREKDFTKQLSDSKLDFALRSKVAGFKLASEFDTPKHRDFLADLTISTLRKNYDLAFDEKDPGIIHLRKNVDGQVTDVYEGNTKLTLDDVLRKEYEPYVVKNNAGAGAGNEGHTPPATKQEFKPSDNRPVTLRDMQLAAAANQGAAPAQ